MDIPALHELARALHLRHCNADADEVASVLLSLAEDKGWFNDPQALVAWLKQLAMDTRRTATDAPRKRDANPGQRRP